MHFLIQKKEEENKKNNTKRTVSTAPLLSPKQFKYISYLGTIIILILQATKLRLNVST